MVSCLPGSLGDLCWFFIPSVQHRKRAVQDLLEMKSGNYLDRPRLILLAELSVVSPTTQSGGSPTWAMR